MTADEVKFHYRTAYLGEEVDDSEFPRLLARAEDALMAATFGRLHEAPAAMQTNVKNALCAQVEWLALNGVQAATTGTGDNSTFVVGHVTLYSSGSKDYGGVTGGACRKSLMYLAQTGLLYNGGVML